VNSLFKNNIVIVLFSFLFNNVSFAELKSDLNQNDISIGFLYGFGFQCKGNQHYHYNVNLLKAQLYYNFYKVKNWDLDILLQPQYNITNFKYRFESNELIKGYEYGVNIGLLLRRSFKNNRFRIYTFLSVGPHFISDAPTRQSNGFIFSDNFSIGINLRLKDNLYFDFRPIYRHISNANLKIPNGGINNLIISSGFMYHLN
jgi:hypothetical protein